MADQIFKEQQKQQTPIQVTREEEKLTFSGEQTIEQQQYQQTQEQTTQQKLTEASSQIMNMEKFSQTDASDPANPPMDFSDEQLREWYDRKKSAQVDARL